ncbi:AbrB/MazE/SpoVT family DNA-binding domain-containing protein [Bacteroidota bacterium]
MKRRIIKQKTAYTLTLPVKWIREYNIQPKDEVELEEEQDSLVIRTEKRPKAEEISLTLEKSTSDYYRIMVENHYLRGYDIINIKFPEKKTFPIIQNAVSNLVGFEILEQKENSCKIGSTTPASAEQFKTLLNRCFNIITYTQDSVKEDIAKLSFPNLTEIEAQSNDARRFLLFCTRALHKTSIVSRRDESFMHLLLERLILIEHNHYYLYNKISKIKSLKIREEVKEIYNKAIEMFNLFKEMFHKKDLKNFATINKYWEEIYFKEGHKLLTKCTEEESIIIYHSMHLSKLLFLISQPNLVTLKIN